MLEETGREEGLQRSPVAAHLTGDGTVLSACGRLVLLAGAGLPWPLPFVGGPGPRCRGQVMSFVRPWARQELKTAGETEEVYEQGPELARGQAHQPQNGRAAGVQWEMLSLVCVCVCARAGASQGHGQLGVTAATFRMLFCLSSFFSLWRAFSPSSCCFGIYILGCQSATASGSFLGEG